MKFILLFCLFFSAKTFAWGMNGHRVVGEVATTHLSKKALEETKKLLGHQTLAQVSNWADFIKSNPEWRHANPWHYVSIPDGKSYKDIKKNPKGDVIWAIKKFSNDLKSKKTTKVEKQQALKFLVHFVGDIHQPLHVGHSHDRGGNSVELKWFGEETNLHRIWDEHLVEMQKMSYTEYTNSINHASKSEVKKWQSDSIEKWVAESMALRTQVYDIVNNSKNYKKYGEYKYNYKNLQTMNQRLLQGGIRLAGLLNSIYN